MERRATDALVSALEIKVQTQKADNYKASETVSQRQKALAVLESLQHDINTRYEASKEQARRRRRSPPGGHKTESETRNDRSEASPFESSIIPGERPGASFTLWPPRTYNASAALRGPRVGEDRLSDFLVATRWDLESLERKEGK